MHTLRCQSLHATGGDARTVARTLLAALDKAAPPSLLLWLADTAQPDRIAAELAAAAPVVVGGVSHAGLVGGGAEYEGKGRAERAVALAVTLPPRATATAWHSTPTGLPDLPAATWEMFATARPDSSPHLLMMGAPPHDAAFPIESFLSTLDRVLPWANKVGGLLAGSSLLYVGAERHDGGVAGVALQGVALDALVCQGATPVGPCFAITEAQGISVLELDGMAVGQHEALDELLRTESAVSGGTLMAGLSVPCGPTAAAGGAEAAAAAAARIAHAPQYVIRPIVSYSREGGALELGARRMARRAVLAAAKPTAVPAARGALVLAHGDRPVGCRAQGGAAAFISGGKSAPRCTQSRRVHGAWPLRSSHVWPPRSGAAPALLEQPGARLQLHRHSAAAAREELRARASAYAAASAAAGRPAAAGGLHVSCLGRGVAGCQSAGLVVPQLGSLRSSGGECWAWLALYCGPRRATQLALRGCRIYQATLKLPIPLHVPHPGAGLYGEVGAESRELAEALGPAAAGGLAGWFAGGEIGPVGQRTFVHTYTTSLALLRNF